MANKELKMIRLGLVGCGGIAKTYISALKEVPQFKLVAILDVKDEKRKIAEEIGADFYTPSKYQKFYDSIDAVVIATPPYLHAEQTILALNAGKHVLCEKPMATTLEDAKRMIKAGEKSKKVLMIASHSKYYHDLIDFIKNKKKYGEILEVECDFLESLLEYTAEDWFYDKKKAGGGCIIDSGVNAIDCLRSALGEIKIVKANARYKPLPKKPSDVETSAEIWFKFGKNRNGKINISWIAGKEKRDIRFKTADREYVVDYLKNSANIGDFMRQEYVGIWKEFYERIKIGEYVDKEGLKTLELVIEAYKFLSGK